MKIAVLLTTYNRIEECKESVLLYKNHFKELNYDYRIFHEYNGPDELHKGGIGEDYFFKQETKGHYEGAVSLINGGVKNVLELYPECDFIVISSGDVRIKSTDYLRLILEKIENNSLDCLFTTWYAVSISTEFMVVSNNFAKKLFPIESKLFTTKSGKLLIKFCEKVQFAPVEFLFFLKLLKHPNLKLGFMPKRPITFYINRFKQGDFYDSSHYEK